PGDRRRDRRGDLARRDAPGRGSGPALRLSRTAPLLALLHSSLSRSSRASGSIVHNWRTGMRALGLIVITMCTALAPAVAAAQDPAELRKQSEQPQKQLDAVNERLRQLEQSPKPASPAGPAQPVPSPAPGVAAPPPATAPPSAMDLARPRQPFGLYQQRG